MTSNGSAENTDVQLHAPAPAPRLGVEQNGHTDVAVVHIGHGLPERGLEYMNVVTAEIEPQSTSKVIAFLKERNVPQYAEIAHLRRIRQVPTGDRLTLEVVLAPEDADVTHILHELGLEGKLTSVPRWPPTSREQVLAWGKTWPLIGRMIAPPLPLPPPPVEKYLSRLSDLLCAKEEGDLPISSLAVEPDTGMVVAEAVDTRMSSGNPVNHSIMNLVGKVAQQELQRRQDRRMGRSADLEEDKYLCQSLDVYTTHEPCVMCAMALVHSRIGRLCYAQSMPHGAVESAYRLHARKELNWRFEAWRLSRWSCCPRTDPNTNP